MEQTLAAMEVEKIKEKYKLSNDPLLKWNLLKKLPTYDQTIIKENMGILGLLHNLEQEMSDYQNHVLKDIRVVAERLFHIHLPEKDISKFSVVHVVTECPNAFVCEHISDESLALGVDTSFFDFFNTILLAGVYYCYEISNAKKNQEKLCIEFLELAKSISLAFGGKGNGRILARQVNVLLKSIENKYPGQLNDFLAYTEFISFPALSFIVGHEIGHVKLNHTKSSDQLKFPGLSSEKAQLLTFKHIREFDSDEWAFSALCSLERTDGYKLLNSKVPSLFFSVLLVFEKFCQPQTDIGKYISSAHPPLEERINRLLTLSKNLSNNDIEHSIIREVKFLEGLTSFFLSSAKVASASLGS